MLPEWTAAATWLVGLGIGIYANRRKTGAESDNIAATTLKGVITELRAEIDRKDEELTHLRERLDAIEQYASTLTDLPPGHLG